MDKIRYIVTSTFWDGPIEVTINKSLAEHEPKLAHDLLFLEVMGKAKYITLFPISREFLEQDQTLKITQKTVSVETEEPPKPVVETKTVHPSIRAESHGQLRFTKEQEFELDEGVQGDLGYGHLVDKKDSPH